MKAKKFLTAIVAFAMILSTMSFVVSAELPERGYTLTIFNEDGTEAMTIDGTKSGSPLRLSTAVPDADAFANNAFLFGIKGTPSYAIDIYQDFVDDKAVTFKYDTTINGNGFSVLYTGKGDYYQTKNGAVVTENDFTVNKAVAEVNGEFYADVKSAMDAAAAVATEANPAVVNLYPGEYELGNFVLPNMEYVTLKGEADGTTVLKNTVLTNAGKASDNLAHITFDGIVFDNSRIYVNGWTAGMNFADWTITNCAFKNLESATSIGGVIQFNLSSAMIVGQYGPYNDVALDGFTFTNNTVSGAYCNGVCSAINSQAMEGTIVIDGNVFDDVDYNAIQLQNVPESATVSITNNTFTNIGKQIIHLNNNLADITVNKNVLVKSNESNYYISHLSTKIDASGNYYGIGTSVEDAVFDANFASKFSVKDEAFVPVINTHYETPDMQNNVVDADAMIGNAYYETLYDAVDAAADGDVIVVSAGEHVLTEKLFINKNITLQGATTTKRSAVNDAVIVANGTNYIVACAEDGVAFENLTIKADSTFTGENFIPETRYNSAAKYAVLCALSPVDVQNCDFVNEGNASRAIFMGHDKAGNLGGGACYAQDCVYNACSFTGFDKPISAMADNEPIGTLTITNNVFNDATEPVNVYWGVDNGATSVTVSENAVVNQNTDEPVRIVVDNYAMRKNDSDVIEVEVTNNTYNAPAEVIVKDIPAGSDVTVADGAEFIKEFSSYEIAEENAEPGDEFYVNYGKNDQRVYSVSTDGTIVAAEKVELVFEKVEEAGALDNSVWNLVLKCADDELINRLNSADFTFELTAKDNMDYEIMEINPEIEINNVNNLKDRYEFHFKNKDNVADTAKAITIGQVRFTGYGEFDFIVKDETTNAVHATTLNDNIVVSYAVNGLVVNNANENTDGDNQFGFIDSEIVAPTSDLIINIAFPNAVENKIMDYQKMTVTVTGEDINDIVIDLGSDMETVVEMTQPNKATEYYTVLFDGGYHIEIKNALTQNTAYDIKVEGAGYRTARYTVNTQETASKTVNFWNNVKDADADVEAGKFQAKKNFLAGDIVKDNNINVYDLSAVVSYFGETELVGNNNAYAKYDLNRDGFIDSKDVAMVLVSWNN